MVMLDVILLIWKVNVCFNLLFVMCKWIMYELKLFGFVLVGGVLLMVLVVVVVEFDSWEVGGFRLFVFWMRCRWCWWDWWFVYFSICFWLIFGFFWVWWLVLFVWGWWCLLCWNCWFWICCFFWFRGSVYIFGWLLVVILRWVNVVYNGYCCVVVDRWVLGWEC